MYEKKLMTEFDKLNRKMKRFFDGFFLDIQLSGIQGLVLQYLLVETEHRDVFLKDLEEFLDVKGSSVTSLINTLEKNGYLKRESLSSDARYKRLVLTDKTYAMKSNINNNVMKYMSSMFQGIPEDNLRTFEQVILQMTKNAEKKND